MNAVKHWVAGDKIQGDRDYQEDEFFICSLTDEAPPAAEDGLLLVLADGMGGHAGGAVASKTVVEGFRDAFHHSADSSIADRFKAGVEAANARVREKQQLDPGLSEMGATLVAAVVRGTHLYWVSVGDSPLWVLRDGRLQRLNADHSMRPLLMDLVELGRMTEEEARNDTRAHQLRSVIFGEPVPLVDTSADGYALERGDTVLLASDGMETLSDEVLAETVRAGGNDAEAIVAALLDAVSVGGKPGRQDNATVIVYCVGGGHDSPLETETKLRAEAPEQPTHSAQEDKSATPGEAVPGEATPGEAVPGEATPDGALPGEAPPDEAPPGEAPPGEAVPSEDVPGTESKSSVKRPGLLGRLLDRFTGGR